MMKRFCLAIILWIVRSAFATTSNALASPLSNLASSAAAAATAVRLTSGVESLPRHEALRAFMTQEKEPGTAGMKSTASVNLIGTSYIAHVTVGTQAVPLLVDTGSSDLWVAPSSFLCLDETGAEVDQSTCGFPVLYEGTFSGGTVPDEYFSIVYGNGQFVYGPYGFESVSLGGITVPDQQIALPSEGYIQVSSGDYAGLLGLAYPAMVPARRGEKPRPAVGNTDPFAEHDTWLFSAIKRNLTEPLFSMALDICGGGLLSVGSIVDVPVQQDFASTPILILNLVNETRAETHFTYYTIIAEDYLVNGQSFATSSAGADTPASRGFPVIVDSGYSTNVLPPSLVNLFYDAFDELPRLVDIRGAGTMLAVPCDAAVPSFGVQIGGQAFEMTRDAILVARLNTTVDGVVMCGLGIQPGIEEAGALGDTFLSSVVAVFDIGASEMRFAQRIPSTGFDQAEFSRADGGCVKDEL